VSLTDRFNNMMTSPTEAVRIVAAFGIKARDVFHDDIGIGRAVTDRLKETGHSVNGFTIGEKSIDESRYNNLKAQALWEAAQRVLVGGKLVKHDDFRQLP